ncbi:RCC1 domain-containing protein [Rugamonas rivuli]|uniref:Uncharacterized protein n=1 Tax=Rugamonas rivuli TaxID=2743358 RepID=A0A843SFE2_9BURK|nr:hypothetical protein [Rugamonas rivuli]MQA20861.1 hypothetical protein [Rugamonas rivuli]
MDTIINGSKWLLKLACQAGVASMLFLAMAPSNAAVATAIGTGNFHSCAALSTGGAKCWGQNSYGQLGNGKTVTSLTPVEVQGLSSYQITAIAGGTYFTCALTSTGSVYCWGFNNYGQLASKTLVSSTTPVAVQIPTGAAKALTVGNNHACVLDTYGNIYCWGSNSGGQLNRNVSITHSSIPLYAAGMNDVVALQGNGFTTCYRDNKGGAKCFGNNKYAQFGIGTKDSTDGATYGAPNYALGLSTNVISTSASMYDGCAVKDDHAVFCWGFNNTFGALGFTGIGIYSTPVAVLGLRNDAISIITGISHTCIITQSGGAQCWGMNGTGQLGNGRAAPQEAASDVIGISEKIISLSLGSNHSCALLESGTVKCFGQSLSGQLGTGTTLYSPVPVTVPL